MSLEVEICAEQAAWDAYVHVTPGASLYHLWVWKTVIEQTYGHPAYYLAARAEGCIQGVLPLVEMKSRLFGHFLVSLPFFNYGGLLASTSAAREALLARAVELARELGAQHIELRQGAPCELGWHDVSPKVAMVVLLPKETDKLWSRLSGRLRNKVRNAQKHGFGLKWGGLDLVDAFYSVFAANMRNLGTPVYPRAWFENVCKALPSAQILTLWHEGKPTAATLITTFGHVVELPWIASLPEERKLNSTVLLYWTALEWAARNGYSEVDLGRCTPGSGPYLFKQQWGCEERALHWYYWLAPGVPVPRLRPDNPRYRLAIRLWQRLPLRVANWLGPRIVRWIP